MLWRQHLLLLLNIARTVPRRLARELLWMCLYWVRVEDLHHLAEVHTLHQLVDFLVIVVVTEHQQHCVDVACLRQADDKVSQVDDACVHLLQQELKSVSKHLCSLIANPEGKGGLSPTQNTVKPQFNVPAFSEIPDLVMIFSCPDNSSI